jgi:hypothetical protein
MAILVIGATGFVGGEIDSSSGGTPTGNYALTITGTSNGVSHSQTLTLTVN